MKGRAMERATPARERVATRPRQGLLKSMWFGDGTRSTSDERRAKSEEMKRREREREAGRRKRRGYLRWE